MPKLRTIFVQDEEIETIANFLKDRLLILPSMPLSERERFPRERCVYFVVSVNHLYYIGCTKNLYVRWRNHHKEEDAIQLPDPRVYWFSCPGLTIDESFRLEQSLIQKIRGDWNGMEIRPDRPFWHRTEIYTSNKVKYARYRYGVKGESFGYMHINGGSATDKIVRERRALIDAMISNGAGLMEIQTAIAKFTAARPGRKRKDDEWWLY